MNPTTGELVIFNHVSNANDPLVSSVFTNTGYQNCIFIWNIDSMVQDEQYNFDIEAYDTLTSTYHLFARHTISNIGSAAVLIMGIGAVAPVDIVGMKAVSLPMPYYWRIRLEAVNDGIGPSCTVSMHYAR
jgi:hypothetical protein